MIPNFYFDTDANMYFDTRMSIFPFILKQTLGTVTTINKINDCHGIKILMGLNKILLQQKLLPGWLAVTVFSFLAKKTSVYIFLGQSRTLWTADIPRCAEDKFRCTA